LRQLLLTGADEVSKESGEVEEKEKKKEGRGLATWSPYSESIERGKRAEGAGEV
jgi:hypothetical protein